ncbi:MAG TPA: HAD family hydrolase [Ktedonobacterales bacterium]|nr:HAD family hydrolase [Ktedonobacterales bacterium]
MGIHGVILDVDGTLLESNDAHARAWADAFAEFGVSAPFALVRPLIGMGADKLLPAVRPDLSKDAGVGKQISQRAGEIFLARYVQGLVPTPGARRLLDRMRTEGLRLVVATSSKQGELDVLLRAANVADLVDGAVTASGIEHSKPNPSIVEQALARLNLHPASALMLGDTPYDIEAAATAGVGTIALRCGGRTDAELAGALAIYDHPADLLAHYDSSPLAGRDAPRADLEEGRAAPFADPSDA